MRRLYWGYAAVGLAVAIAAIPAAKTWLPRDSSAHFALVNLLENAKTPAELGHGRPASTIEFGDPVGLSRGPDEALYVSDRGRGAIGHVVWRIGSDGTARVVAGTGRKGRPSLGGPAVASDLASPESLAFDAAGNLLIADSLNNAVLRVDTDGIITRVAGNGKAGYSGDGGPANQARLNRPYDVRVDDRGNVYIADYANNRIRVVDPAGTIRTFAGNGSAGYAGDSGPAAQASLDGPYGVLPLAHGAVLIADSGNNVVRRVRTDGIIETIAGTGEAGYSGDGGLATRARLDSPQALFEAADSSILVNDEHNYVIRVIGSDGMISSLAGDGTAGTAPDGTSSSAIRFRDPENAIVFQRGILVSDGDDRRVRYIEVAGAISTFAGHGTAGLENVAEASQ